MPEPKGPKPPVPGLLMIQPTFSTDSKAWSIIFHILKTAAVAWGLGDINTVVAAVTRAIVNDWLPSIGANVTHVNTKATDLTSNMGLQVTGTGGGAGTDSAKTTPVPINCPLRVNFPPSMRFKGGRPGMNLSVLDQTDRLAASATMWSTATLATWQSNCEEFFTDLNLIPLTGGETASPVWVSYFSKFAFREPPLCFDIGTGPFEIQQRICSRRKRLGKGIPGE